MNKEIKKQEIYFIAKYIGEQIAGKPEDEKMQFSTLVINSFKKIDRKWESEIVEEIWEAGFTFAFTEESANIGKLIERYIYLMDLKKETSENIYKTIKTKAGNIFELLKGYFYETAFLFFNENFLDTESDMTVRELGKQIYASLEEYARDDANVQDMLEEEEFEETMKKLKQYN
jgi:hypothetical protein